MSRPQAFTLGGLRGGWYVKYHDGLESMNMPHRNAKEYSNIFGGTVIKDEGYIYPNDDHYEVRSYFAKCAMVLAGIAVATYIIFVALY